MQLLEMHGPRAKSYYFLLGRFSFCNRVLFHFKKKKAEPKPLFRWPKWTLQGTKSNSKTEQCTSLRAAEEAHWELFLEAAGQVFLRPTHPPDAGFFSVKYILLGNLSMAFPQE